jgi:hypothetical protein
MPSFLVKAFAKKYNRSVEEVERIWKETAREASKKLSTKSDLFYAYVNATVNKKLGGVQEAWMPFQKRFQVTQEDLVLYEFIEVDVQGPRDFVIFKDGEVYFYEGNELVNVIEDHDREEDPVLF